MIPLQFAPTHNRVQIPFSEGAYSDLMLGKPVSDAPKEPIGAVTNLLKIRAKIVIQLKKKHGTIAQIAEATGIDKAIVVGQIRFLLRHKFIVSRFDEMLHPAKAYHAIFGLESEQTSEAEQ
jgi:hypothetical protein